MNANVTNQFPGTTIGRIEAFCRGAARRVPELHPDGAPLAPSGFTMLEVLIALFILSLTVTADFALLITADHAAGTGKTVACAGILAGNEAERIKSFAGSTDIVGDTSYADSVEGMNFEVRRTVVRGDSSAAPGTTELEIAVVRLPGDNVVARQRVLQGSEKP